MPVTTGKPMHRANRQAVRSGPRRLLVLGFFVLTLAACAAEPADTISVTITVSAGPVCPVVTDPPDPDCADRPVAGAELVVLGRNGRKVTTVRTDANGRTSISVPAGTYTIRPQPVPGLMGTPGDVPLVVDGSTPALTIGYDTGIR